MPLLHAGAQRQKAEKEPHSGCIRWGLAQREHHRSGELSGGEQQRDLHWPVRLITSPSFCLADEPTGDLDSPTAETVFELIGRLHRDLQLSSLIATHNLLFARRCHRVLRLQNGKMEEISPESLPA